MIFLGETRTLSKILVTEMEEFTEYQKEVYIIPDPLKDLFSRSFSGNFILWHDTETLNQHIQEYYYEGRKVILAPASSSLLNGSTRLR